MQRVLCLFVSILSLATSIDAQYEPPTNTIFISGQPGVGKSCTATQIINHACKLAGYDEKHQSCKKFEWGPSFDGRGVTKEVSSRVVPGLKGSAHTFTDVPGLSEAASDPEMRKNVNAYFKSQSGQFAKLVYVFDGGTGRATPEQLNAMFAIMGSLGMDQDGASFAILVNKWDEEVPTDNFQAILYDVMQTKNLNVQEVKFVDFNYDLKKRRNAPGFGEELHAWVTQLIPTKITLGSKGIEVNLSERLQREIKEKAAKRRTAVEQKKQAEKLKKKNAKAKSESGSAYFIYAFSVAIALGTPAISGVFCSLVPPTCPFAGMLAQSCTTNPIQCRLAVAGGLTSFAEFVKQFMAEKDEL